MTTPGPGEYDDGKDLAHKMQKKSQGNKKPFNCEEKRQPEYNN